MLLDERLLEDRGHAIARLSGVRPGKSRTASAVATLVLLFLSCAIILPTASHAQKTRDADRLLASFSAEWPDLYARLIGLERAHGVLYGALIQSRGKLKEPDVYRRMTERLAADAATRAARDLEAEKGYDALGARGAEIIRRTQAFHREVLAIFAGVDAPEREHALEAAVDRYLSKPNVSLPDAPKDMGILYDHPYTAFVNDEFNPRRELKYPTLNGFVWASHWFQLAAQEPLDASVDKSERVTGLKIVNERFDRKLSNGTPPDAYPTELPLAPSIAPLLVSASERAAAIIDNLNMMHDVLADVAVHPKVTNLRAAMDEVITQFTDRSYRIVEVDDWITMALRHSIFEQGGPALGTMTRSERNNSGHLQHLRGGRAIPPGGMR
jgi:hypothetical protein